MTPEQNLIVAAARLAHAAPDSWDEYIKAFHAYSWSLAEHVVSSPPDVLIVNQGRAQGVSGLGRLLADCRKTANAMEEAKKV
jgi:hypothetical protein